MKALVVEDSNDIAEIIETIFLVRWTDAEIIRLDTGAHVADVVESQAARHRRR